MHKRVPTHVLATAALTVAAVGALGAGAASAHESDSRGDENRAVTLKADLHELNDSGAWGRATAVLKDGEISKLRVRAYGLTPSGPAAPHAQHIHYGEQAANECPGIELDKDKDGRINTVEGIPAYGPVVVSLTTSGDTTPASTLAVDRYPVAEDGRYNYRRSHIKFTDVAGTGYAGGGTAAEIRKSIMEGEGVVVIHGVDYDKSGGYSFSKEGKSELDPSLPREATDPAVCGVLK